MPALIKTVFSLFAYCAFSLHNTELPRSPQASGDNPVQYGIPFNHVPNREDAIIYQVNMRAFSKEGNFAGVTARLDSIAALGVNVIYLMPIYPVGTLNSVNSPYCLKDYRSINSEFGNLADLRTLVDGAHSRNMSVILDWVGNHTAWDHTWINQHPNWYWHDSTGKIAPPPGTGWNDVAQLDFSNMDMRQAMITDMKYWVYTANVDGFRCDYADNPPADFWKQAIDTLRNIPGHKLLFLAEGTRSSNYTAGFDYNFGFAFFQNLEIVYHDNRSPKSIDSLNRKDYTDATGGRQIVRYTTNHDVNSSDGTPLSLFGGKEGAMGAFVIAACMKGVPMIYNGQEVGMDHRIVFPFTTTKVDWTADPSSVVWYKKIISIRKNSNAIKYGALTSYSTNAVCAFTKTAAVDSVFILVNVRNKTVRYHIPSNLRNSTWTDAINGGQIKLNKKAVLHPYAYMILEKK